MVSPETVKLTLMNPITWSGEKLKKQKKKLKTFQNSTKMKAQHTLLLSFTNKEDIGAGDEEDSNRQNAERKRGKEEAEEKAE